MILIIMTELGKLQRATIAAVVGQFGYRYRFSRESVKQFQLASGHNYR